MSTKDIQTGVNKGYLSGIEEPHNVRARHMFSQYIRELKEQNANRKMKITVRDTIHERGSYVRAHKRDVRAVR